MSSDARSAAIIGGILGAAAIGTLIVFLTRVPAEPPHAEPPAEPTTPPTVVERAAPVAPAVVSKPPIVRPEKPRPKPRPPSDDRARIDDYQRKMLEALSRDGNALGSLSGDLGKRAPGADLGRAIDRVDRGNVGVSIDGERGGGAGRGDVRMGGGAGRVTGPGLSTDARR